MFNKEELQKIKMGHPSKYGPYIIDRYMAGNGLGWIVQAPGQKPFISRDPEKVLKHISIQDEIEDLGNF
jgi:hypothetical protein